MFAELIRKNDLAINAVWIRLPASNRRRLLLLSGGDVGRLTLARVMKEAAHLLDIQEAILKVMASVMAATEAA